LEDDGSAFQTISRVEFFARGKRLSENAEGAGLGLAIVLDIIEAYGGEITLFRSGLGGLSVTMVWRRTAMALAN
jgi:signal transduction histidine kinase